MPKLILVRHSLPEIVPTLPAKQWPLSETGRRRCRPLADKLAAHPLDVIVTSSEPKAVETGRLVADLLGKPWATAEGLHEHDRSNVGWFEDRDQFQAAVAGFFREPGRLVFGSETADQIHLRFAQAVAGVRERRPGQNVAIVAHGTVIALYAARAAGLDPFPLWKRLGLPAFVVTSWPSFGLLNVVEGG